MKENNYPDRHKNIPAKQSFPETNLLVLLVAAIILLVYIIWLVFSNNIVSLDENMFNAIAPHMTESRTRLMKAISFLGNYQFLIPANLLLLSYFLFLKKNNLGLRMAVVALSSLSVMSLLKRLFHRNRPAQPLVDGVTNFSFPSGHAFMSVAFYGLLIWLAAINIANKKVRRLVITFLLSLILVIGFSRIYLRMHYTSDVVAGFCMGFVWLMFCLWLTDKAQQGK